MQPDDIYTGLTRDTNRWYDPSTGKWLSQDPTGFGGQDADLSRYADNSPTNAIDPNGTDTNSSWTPYLVMTIAPWTAPAFAAGAVLGPQPLNSGIGAAMAQAHQAQQAMGAWQPYINAQQLQLAGMQGQQAAAANAMGMQQQINAQAQHKERRALRAPLRVYFPALS